MAGGKSSRFGKDKLSQNLYGKLLIEHVVEATKGFSEILIVGKFPDKFRHIKSIKFVLEPFTDFSPIYGIITGLRAAKNEKILFLPGDTPFLKAEVLKTFSREFPPAVISEGDNLHSLFFLISKFQICIVEKFLKSRKHKVFDLHYLMKSKRVDVRKFLHLDYQKKSLINLNTRKELYEVISR